MCASRPLLGWLRSTLARRPGWPALATVSRTALGAAAVAGAAVFAGALVLANTPARSSSTPPVAPLTSVGRLPQVTIGPSKGVATQLDRRTALSIARNVVTDLRIEADALRLRDAKRAAGAAAAQRLVEVRRRIRAAAGKPIAVPTYSVEHMRVALRPGQGQGPPVVLAALQGQAQLTTYQGSPAMVVSRTTPAVFTQTLELSLTGNRYLIIGVQGETPVATSVANTVPSTPSTPTSPAVKADFAGVQLRNVASRWGSISGRVLSVSGSIPLTRRR